MLSSRALARSLSIGGWQIKRLICVSHFHVSTGQLAAYVDTLLLAFCPCDRRPESRGKGSSRRLEEEEETNKQVAICRINRRAVGRLNTKSYRACNTQCSSFCLNLVPFNGFLPHSIGGRLSIGRASPFGWLGRAQLEQLKSYWTHN